MKIVEDNPNTSDLWDSLLFAQNRQLLSSGIYQDKLRKVIGLLKNCEGRILDIGFGMGNLEKLLLEERYPVKIFGIDISIKAVKRAKKIYKGNFRIGKAEDLPYKSFNFDAIIMLDVFEHIYKDKAVKVLAEVKRVLKKDGISIISVPLNEDIKKPNETGMNDNRHVREFTPGSLIKELKIAGFEVLQTELLYAFRNFYQIKSFVIKLFPKLRKPNLIVVYARKK